MIVLDATSQFISENLFDDVSGYEFVYPWQRFVVSLRHYLETKSDAITRVVGTSKIVSSMIDSNVSIGDFCLIRNSIIEADVRIGAHVQLNMSIIRRGTELPHFNNVAYSFLGRDVLFGASATTSSRRFDEKLPFVVLPNGDVIEAVTNRFGALIGDGCRIGSHVCINPFTVIAKNKIIYPGKSISGYVPR